MFGSGWGISFFSRSNDQSLLLKPFQLLQIHPPSIPMKRVSGFGGTFLLFFLITFIIYLPAGDGKFVNDTFDYLNEIEQTGAKGILSSYNMIFLCHVPSLFYYLIYRLFGLHWLGWHVVFAGFHSLNAALLVRLLRKLISEMDFGILWLAAALFLLSPFQTEVVAWGATFHYLLIVTFLLTGALSMLNYLKLPSGRLLLYYHLSFAGALLCYEQAFLYPAVFAIMAVGFIDNPFERSFLRSMFLRFLLPNALMIALYFIATKWVYGVWVAHYGAEKHVVLDLNIMYECLLHYLAKFMVFFRYLPDEMRALYHQPVLHQIIRWSLPVMVILLSAFIFWSQKMTSQNKKVLGMLAVSFFLMLLPVLNLDQSFTFEIQSDRYGYVASVFFYPLIVLLLYYLLNRKVFLGTAMTYLAISVLLLIPAVGFWGKSGAIGMQLIRDYPLKDGQQAYLLNLPDNYKGAYMFRNGFPKGLNVVKGGQFKDDVHFIARVNILSADNETSVSKLSDSVYYVKCEQYGKWYYHLGQGAYDYSTEDYKVDFDEWNTAYTLTITDVKDTIYLLKCHGDEWQMVDTLMP